MSFQNRSFGQKPVKKKKQDFHRHKIKPEELGSLDQKTLKEKTMLALSRLGDQRFSQQPGGYTFENWMKSFNLLLDDFEENARAQQLPKEYFAKRLELSSALIHSNQSFELDLEINKLKEEEDKLLMITTSLHLQSKIDRENEERNERIRSLEEEKSVLLRSLEKASYNLDARKKQIQDSQKLLKRLFSSKTSEDTPIETLEARVVDARSKLEAIEKKINDQRKKIESAPKVRSEGLTVLEADEKLESVQIRLSELEEKRLEASELLEKRKEVTSQMSEIISKIELQ